MKVIKAIYNFIVGDMVILIGVILAVIILSLINNVAALAPVSYTHLTLPTILRV